MDNLMDNLMEVLDEIENNIKELNFITRQDKEYIEVKCYNKKTKDLLYDRYDTILDTLKYHQGMLRLIKMKERNFK